MILRTCILFMVLFCAVAQAVEQEKPPYARARDSLHVLLSNSALEDTARVNLLFALVEVYYNYYETYHSGRIVSKQALDLSRKAGYKKGEAWALLYIGKGLNNNSQVASGYFRQAGELFRQLNDQGGLANTWLQNGVLMYTQNNFSEALSYFKKSLSLYKELNDESRVARLQHLCGLAFTQTGDYANALNNLQSALTTYIRLQKKKESFECRLGIADAYYKSGYYDDAMIYYRMCHVYSTQYDMPEMTAISALGMGNIFMLKGDVASAETVYMEAYQNKYIRHNPWKVLPITDALFRLHEKKGNYGKALEYLKQSRQSLDTLYNEKNMAAMASLKSEQDIIEAETALLKSKLQNAADNRIKIMLVSILGVLIVIAYGIARRYRLKKIMAQHLEEKNKALNQALISLKSAEAQLIKAEKMAVFGKLSAGIAHEIRNPLNFITNFSELSQQIADDFVHAEDPSEQREMSLQLKKLVDKIGYHGRRADSIVTRMLQHSRSAHTETELTDVNRLADEFSDLAYESMRNLITNFECRLEKNLDMHLEKVWLVPQDLSRVIINLLNNAFYAVHDKKHLHLDGYMPKVTIRTWQKGDEVLLSIHDNGNGIPESAKEKVFEPFFTTKPIGEGTGLGLSICADIVKAAGGRITMSSSPADGTEFVVAFPAPDSLHLQTEPQDDLRQA